MMMPLPFSGLSLVVHLGIIALAFIAGLLGFKKNHSKGFDTKGRFAGAIMLLKPVVSLLILGFVGAITLLFIWVALSTGVESGANEPQRIFLGDVVHAVGTGDYRSLFESQIHYQKTSPLYPFPTISLS